jgi:hypothetical protein
MNDSNFCIGVVIIKVFNHFKKFDSKWSRPYTWEIFLVQNLL